MSANSNTTNIFNVYLAEYNTLRSELLARIQTQNQAFNFLLIIVGASITAIITTANSNNPSNLVPTTFAIVLLLPLVSCPLAYMFFDNELMIHAIGSYIYWDRRLKFVELTNDQDVFRSITDFKFLPSSTHQVFQPISRGRWYLFCIPTFLPVIFLPIYTFVKWPSLPDYSRIIDGAAVIIFILDLVEVFILAKVIIWIFDNNKHQHKLTAEAKQNLRLQLLLSPQHSLPVNIVTSSTASKRDNSRGQTNHSIFQSFWMGGFECSTHRLPRRKVLGRFAGLRVDLIAATRHDEFALQDYERLRDVGIRTARDGVRWHLIEKSSSRYDFSSLVPMLRAARRTQTQVVWDLFHYGWPDGLKVWSAAFVDRFARFARAAASVILEETGSPIYVTPVNEISYVSWAGADAGFLNPFGKRRGPELKTQLVRAAIAAVQAVREVDPNARICHVEPIIHIAADEEHPEEAAAAEAYRQAQFEAWDMISGKRCPELGGCPEYLDILGVNYYWNNQWIHQDPNVPPSRRRKHILLPPSHPLHRPIHKILREVYERYGRPLFIAETGIEGDDRPSWLRYIAQEARAASASGIPLEGLCLYPIVDYPGWGDDRHCHSGLWDYANDQGWREIYKPWRQELAQQQRV